MTTSAKRRWARALDERRARGLERRRRLLESAQGPEIVVDGKRCLSFCSNDYLGLANHPAVVEAFREAAGRYGVGSGASHLVSGHALPHHALEEELAAFCGRSRALLFSSGYMANMGVLAALAGKGDRVYEDRLNHASLLDGGLFSGARFQRYPHGDVERLRRMLDSNARTLDSPAPVGAGPGPAREPPSKAGSRARPAPATEEREAGISLIVSDGVFSMDGDLAPLPALVETAAAKDALLMIDDAHGFGCLGEEGGGTLAWYRERGLAVDEDNCQVLIGTLGKAFGTAGAFVTGSAELIETLIQFCRPYIYTTALPPALAEATRRSLRLLREERWRRERLQDYIRRFRERCSELGFELIDSPTPIQALVLGGVEAALAASEALQARGIHVSAIRPPTVPEGTARLRFTFSAAHEEAQFQRLLEALESLTAYRTSTPSR